MSYLDGIQYLIYKKKNIKVILKNFKVIIFIIFKNRIELQYNCGIVS